MVSKFFNFSLHSLETYCSKNQTPKSTFRLSKYDPKSFFDAILLILLQKDFFLAVIRQNYTVRFRL